MAFDMPFFFVLVKGHSLRKLNVKDFQNLSHLNCNYAGKQNQLSNGEIISCAFGRVYIVLSFL